MALLLALPAGLWAAQPDVPTAAPVPNATVAPVRTVLPWIDEVVKLNAAGVPPDVIKNYITNSTSRSTLTADDIIYLRNSNVSSDLITAMITHGATASTMVASTPVPAPAPQNYQPQPYQPPVAYSDQTVTPDYDYYPPSSYAYNYSYPAYYPYYPIYWYPYTTFFVGHRDFRGDRFRRSNFGTVARRNFGVVRTTSTAHFAPVNAIGNRTGRR